jgi:NAD(P)-dependent dehydrogenase (short-subunit alcohol dehydrogenase family)
VLRPGAIGADATDLENFEFNFAGNTRHVFEMITAGVPHLKAAGADAGPAIVNVSSVNGLQVSKRASERASERARASERTRAPRAPRARRASAAASLTRPSRCVVMAAPGCVAFRSAEARSS